MYIHICIYIYIEIEGHQAPKQHHPRPDWIETTCHDSNKRTALGFSIYTFLTMFSNTYIYKHIYMYRYANTYTDIFIHTYIHIYII